MQRQHPVHDAGGRLQILDGLEQRHDVDGAAAGGLISPTSFSSTATSSMSDMPLHMEMMHWWITSVPKRACASAAARNTASSPSVSSLYLTKAELSGLALRNSLSSRLMRASSPERQIGHSGDRRIEQFRHGAFMHRRILPDIEPGEMEAEAVDGPPQRPQAAARDHAGIVRDQRTVEHVEIGLEFVHGRVGRGLADRPAGGLDLELQRGRRSAGHKCRTPRGDRVRRFGAARNPASARPARAILRKHRQGAPRATVRRPATCNSSR